jgi:hypothetical protein
MKVRPTRAVPQPCPDWARGIGAGRACGLSIAKGRTAPAMWAAV